ncbi:MAG: D-alanyl-D-alanine carboxypeptidase/D-alanyl-D-alanine-endopeptidase [Bacteroidales bacterium]|nr:D-alanyl-D-alanine carboxypeptidase/D-alanyl-D-alanine-endopeptidase [Bacteroidales bacterium]
MDLKTHLTLKPRWVIPVVGLLFFLYGCTGKKATAPVKSASIVPLKTISAPVKNPLVVQLETFLKDSALLHASLSYCFLDATNDSLIASCNAELSLVPASTMKLFITAAALEILGPETRFRTHLLYEGTISNHTLHGNIIIKGGGDPTFCMGEQTMKILFTNWSNAIKKLGIDSVDGSIIGDGRIFDSEYIPYTWTWGEINMGYCAAASGLSVNGNIYQLFFEPFKEKRFASDLKKVIPYIPEEAYYNRVVETETDEEDIFLVGHPLTNRKTIMGIVNKEKKEVSIVAAISNPPLAAATEFFNSLARNGVHISGKAWSVTDSDSLMDRLKKASPVHVTMVASPTVAAIVHTTNQASYNFFAENLLKHIGLNVSHHGGTEAGALAVRRFWQSKGMDMGGFAMFDGSGISRFNTVTARQLIWLLSYMRTAHTSADFLTSLSVAGVSGTLRTMCINSAAEGNVQAKSGTMSRVKSYTGYAKTKTGRTVIFAIIVNNFEGPSAEIKQKIGQIMDAMARL